MRQLVVTVLALCLCYGPATSRGARGLDLSELAGAYEAKTEIAVPREEGVEGRTDPNVLPDWVVIETTNLLVIEPLAVDAAYVRADLSFSNYHGCAVREVMSVEAGMLVLRMDDGSESPSQRCVLRLRPSQSELVFEDEQSADGSVSCNFFFCGARGGLHGESFPRASRVFPPPTEDTSRCPSCGPSNAELARRAAIEEWRVRREGE